MKASLKMVKGSAISAVLILAILPAIDGYIFKSGYAEHLSAWQAAHLKVTLLSYHEGWLSSDAEILVEDVSSAGSPSSHASTVLDQHISHGPFVSNPITNHWGFAEAIITTKLHIAEALGPMLLGNQTHQELFSIQTVAGFNGIYNTQLKIPAISKDTSMVSFSWQGLNGNLIVDASNHQIRRIQSDMDLGALSMQGAQGQGSVVTKDITVQYELTPDASGLWNGSYSLIAPQIALINPNANVNISNVKLSDLFNVTSNNYNNDLQISVDQFAVPDYSLSQSNLRLTFKNINAAGLSNIVKALTALQGRSISPNEYAQYSNYVPGIFTPTTAVDFNTAINSQYGHLVIDGSVNWPQTVKTMQDVATNANAKINIRIAVGVVNKLIDVMAQKAQTKTDDVDAAAAPAINTQPSEENLLAQIDTWATNQKIDADVSETLKDLVQAHLSAVDFAKNVDGVMQRKELTPDLAAQLKLAYNQVLAAKNNPQPAAVVAAQPQPTQPSVSPTDQIKQQWDGYVKAGYLTLDKDDYVSTITVVQGVLKANGIVVK